MNQSGIAKYSKSFGKIDDFGINQSTSRQIRPKTKISTERSKSEAFVNSECGISKDSFVIESSPIK